MELNDYRTDSKVRYGQEHGKNLIKIAKKLLKNEELVMLLSNTDLNPIDKVQHPEKVNGFNFLHTLVKVVPFLDASDESVTTKITILFDDGTVNATNSDNENIAVVITVYCPFQSWVIAGDDLRPFAVMAEIRKSLQDVRINGLGEIKYLGFDLATLTEEMGVYNMRFKINAFS